MSLIREGPVLRSLDMMGPGIRARSAKGVPVGGRKDSDAAIRGVCVVVAADMAMRVEVFKQDPVDF